MTYSFEMLQLAPFSRRIEPDACLFSEAYFIFYLAKSKLENLPVKTLDTKVMDGNKIMHEAKVITKQDVPDIGYPTSLILKCEEGLLEGMITTSTVKKTVIRPFCDAADYSKRLTRPPIIQINNELNDMREKLKISDDNAVGMLTSLLDLTGLSNEIGSHFFDNIAEYTDYVLANKLNIGHWLEYEPIKSNDESMVYPEEM